MKLHHVMIRNFKRIAGPLEIDFAAFHPTDMRQLTCLTGDNGSGKTTVLQAIALLLSMATRRTRFSKDFNWHGYEPERISSQGPTRIELRVSLDADEIELTQRLFREWYDSQTVEWIQSRHIVQPSTHSDITLIFEEGKLTSDRGFEGLLQFLGRHYIKAIARNQPDKRSWFSRIGDVFWFDQYRNLGSIVNDRLDGEYDSPRKPVGWQTGVSLLREHLVGMWGYHTSPNRVPERDYIASLEARFAELFPGTMFRGLELRENVETTNPHDFFFLLERNGLIYDLAEMSSGEQAVFPLVYEFVRLSIAKSIVLIDELELHLHPPEQQGLLASLSRIGPDCQYLITTHSKYLTSIIPQEHMFRMEGGRRCL
jgi:energy-coupling factor transporter ATP-binding protein EcfA2